MLKSYNKGSCESVFLALLSCNTFMTMENIKQIRRRNMKYERVKLADELKHYEHCSSRD